MRVALLGAVLAAGCAAGPRELQRASSTIRVLAAEPCAPLGWPVDAAVSSLFGRRDGRPHLGIDLAVPEDTEVRAACGGVVTYAADRLRGYGRMIVVEHAAGLATVYAHNRRLLVAEGEAVGRGQVIARSGATGHVTAPHVHFEVRRDGSAVDPLGLLGARPGPRIGYARRPPGIASPGGQP